MKNDPYFKLIAGCIVLGLLLAIVSTQVHAAVPLPPVHVMAKAPHWQMVLNQSGAKAHHFHHVSIPAAPAALPPAMPAPAAVELHLGG